MSKLVKNAVLKIYHFIIYTMWLPFFMKECQLFVEAKFLLVIFLTLVMQLKAIPDA